MTDNIHKLIYDIDPNATIRNAMAPAQSSQIDILANGTGNWNPQVNPYDESVLTLTNQAFFVFSYTVKIRQAKAIRFANNIIVNGINTFSFSQGNASVYTFAASNQGRSIPLWVTYNRLFDNQQESLYQTSQIQDASIVSGTRVVDLLTDSQSVMTSKICTYEQYAARFNGGRNYYGGVDKDMTYQDQVMLPLMAIAPTVEPLNLAKGVMNFQFNFNFQPQNYLNLLPTQLAEDLLQFVITKCDLFFTTVKFSQPIPRPVVMRPCKMNMYKLQGGPWNLDIISGRGNSGTLEINSATAQLAPGKLLKIVVFPQITKVGGLLKFKDPAPYTYIYNEAIVTPNQNNNYKNYPYDGQTDNGLTACLSKAFEITNIKISIDGGVNYLPINSPPVYYSDYFGDISNYVYSFLQSSSYDITANNPKSMISYEMYKSFFQIIAINAADVVNLGSNSQVVISFSIYPCVEFLNTDPVTVTFDADYALISIEN